MAKTNSHTLISIDDSRWKSIIKRCHSYDFYHTQVYHKIDSNTINGSAVLLVSEIDNDLIAMPIIIRDINNTHYNDCTSVYGFCGPVSNLPFDEIPSILISQFTESLKQFFKENHIITAFSRLHPLTDTERILEGFGKIRRINKTVALDLRLLPEEQYRQYRKSNKSEINQLRKKKGYTVIEATTEDELYEFVDIYHENMKRVNASDYYFFDREYFKTFLKNDEFESKLLLSIKDDKITAGAIFSLTNKIMQYHLAATRLEYVRDTPMKLVIDEARILGNELGMEFLHLGGGIGGRDDDSLFRFKSGFSQFNGQYSAWQYISDEGIYTKLIAMFGKSRDTEYFPAYRSPE